MMDSTTKNRNYLWMAGGSGLVIGVFMAMYFLSHLNPEAQVEKKSQRLELLDEARIALAAASEAQNGAVMSSADEDRRLFVDQARVASEELNRSLTALETLLSSDRDEKKMNLIAGVRKAYHEFESVDQKLSELAMLNTNRKAYALADGPAAKILEELDKTLSTIAEQQDGATAEDKLRISQMANTARIALLRTQVLLFPHISEERDDKMDELETLVATEHDKVVKSLDALNSQLGSEEASPIKKALALYAEFVALRTEIIKLSRANTNVRSLSLALTDKRHAVLAVQDSMAALESLIKSEPIRSPIPRGR